MAERTEIAWCDSTFNPWIGCTKVSPGCDNCYAKANFDDRKHRAKWGPGNPRSRTSAVNWKLPMKWNAQEFVECGACGHRCETPKFMRMGIGGLDSHCPNCDHSSYRLSRRRVFCASLADVFDNEVDPEWRRDLFRLIAATQDLDWLLLTKRIGNAHKMLNEVAASFGMTWGEHWRNVWLGATIVNQEEADRDIPKLLATPARVRFLSMEPLLGPVDITPHLWGRPKPCDDCPKDADCECGYARRGKVFNDPALHWVIAGGESGPKARPMHPDWARSLRDQCAAAGVPFLFKQVGEAVPVETDVDCDHGHTVYPLDDNVVLPGDRYKLHTAGSGQYFVRVGKKASGRLLDGVTHDGFPEVA